VSGPDELAFDGRRARLGPCYAEWTGEALTIGNDLVERRWRLADGRLWAESLRDKPAGREWLARVGERPSPAPQAGFTLGEGEVGFTARRLAGPVSEPSLVVQLTVRAAKRSLVWRFRIFPAAAAVVTQLVAEGEGSERSAGRSTERAPEATGVELDDAPGSDLPADDLLDFLAPAGTHLRLIQVTLRDRTDLHGELVFENEWLLHPNEARLELSGNLFVLGDVMSGEGLVFLKHAPLPHARPMPAARDLLLTGTPMCFPGRRTGEPYGPEDPAWPLAYRLGLYGHGLGAEGGEGFPLAVLAYSGGSVGRTAALQRYWRQVRPVLPSRDGLLVSNTWGDRSRDERICEDFLLGELAAGERLGVDVVQIDDGWQQGISSNSARGGGVWEGYWQADVDFWRPDGERFPNGLAPLVEEAKRRGLRLGLWFAPDSSDDFANWRRDADCILRLHRELGVEHFKIDAVTMRSKTSERNLHRFIETVLHESDGRVVFDMDVTAQTRPGYFALPEAGPVFVENRYTDFRRYWPHQTLRVLWKLSRWLDPVRLRMEFLNNERNADLYAGDPLAPAAWSPAALFATVMLSSPLAWAELQNLPESYFAEAAKLVQTWREHRGRLAACTVHPVGAAPDGASWTGFAADAGDGGGYLLAFRELSGQAEETFALPGRLTDAAGAEVLGGEGEMSLVGASARVHIPEPLGYLFARLAAK
jgi:alpha-galactosidase